jgi:hypothetical protein
MVKVGITESAKWRKREQARGVRQKRGGKAEDQ